MEQINRKEKKRRKAATHVPAVGAAVGNRYTNG